MGLVAQIPAGLGVFEAVLLVELTPALSTPATVSSKSLGHPSGHGKPGVRLA